MMKLLIFTALVCSTLLPVSETYRILFYHDGGTRSHLNLYFPLIEELLDRRHTVTGVFYASANIKHANYTEVLTRYIAGDIIKNVSSIFLEESSRYRIFNPNVIMKMIHILPEYFEKMVEVVKTKELQKIMMEDYDVVISTSPQVGYVAEMLDAPIIFLSPAGPWPAFTERIGNRFYPSLYPSVGISFNNPEHLGQRFMNLVSTYGFKLWVMFIQFILDSKHRSELGYTGPSLSDTCKNRAEILLSNSHFVTHDPEPFLENVIHVGGLHIRKPKPLPSDLQIFLNSHPEGVVYVSFGSAITPSSMKEDKRMAFIKAFRRLKMPVIWKWDTERTDDIPKNVLVRDWLPQQDLLAHPNLKVFVTHGGLLSVMEAIYSETLLVGIPLANDQGPNLSRLELKNLGIMLDFDQLSDAILAESIEKALTDTKMRESMIRTSKLFRDSSEPPVKKAAWWVEYTIRNNGTAFLQPLSKDLVWYKAMNLDILFLTLLISFLVIYVNFKIMKTCVRCCCGSRKAKVE